VAAEDLKGQKRRPHVDPRGLSQSLDESHAAGRTPGGRGLQTDRHREPLSPLTATGSGLKPQDSCTLARWTRSCAQDSNGPDTTVRSLLPSSTGIGRDRRRSCWNYFRVSPGRHGRSWSWILVPALVCPLGPGLLWRMKSSVSSRTRQCARLPSKRLWSPTFDTSAGRRMTPGLRPPLRISSPRHSRCSGCDRTTCSRRSRGSSARAASSAPTTTTVFQSPSWEAATAFDFVQERKRGLRIRLGLDTTAPPQPSVARLKESGVFREARELLLHSVEEGDGQRLVGFALSEGSTRTLLEAGTSETEVGLDRLRTAAAAILEPVPWWIGYRAWIGLR
jgi:hypothetical protein